MKPIVKTVAIVLSLGALISAQAGELGMKAPALQISHWVKGDAVDVTDGKAVYVVEFWATWCPPCRESIPHLTELQKKYGDKVVFVGISDEKKDVVEKFVTKQGDKMDYVVAIDKKDGTSKGYMREFGQNGIPHAFIVDKKGKIVWHDHPMSDLHEVIDLVLADKFDADAAKKIQADREKAQKELMQVAKMMQQYFELVSSADKGTEAAALGSKILAKGGENANLLNTLSWQILTDERILTRDLDLALKAAEMANTLTEGNDANTLDTLGLAYFKNGKKAEAIKVQKKAVALAEKAGDERALEEFKNRLKEFEDGE